MAYGTSTGVTLIIGGTDSVTFDATNITASIAMADTIVDTINAGAADAKKTLASNLIAAQILLRGRGYRQLKGLASDGGISGRPSKSAAFKEYIPPEAYLLLLVNVPGPTFSQNQPDESGEFT